jgi:squalene-hopene cyclase-like protein
MATLHKGCELFHEEGGLLMLPANDAARRHSEPSPGSGHPTPSGATTAAQAAAQALALAQALVDTLEEQPWGHISASIYESARLVTLAPWLGGGEQRVRFLLDHQDPEGSWGNADGYRLVPTLSAAEAGLTALMRGDAILSAGLAAPLARCVDGALAHLYGWLGQPEAPLVLPDTPAIEIIVPSLVAAINAHLAVLREAPAAWGGGTLEPWSRAQPLRLPEGMDNSALHSIHALLASRSPLPAKLLHSLEVAAPLPAQLTSVVAASPGTVGASPAATAAWLGSRPAHQRDPEAVRYLQEVAAGHGGAVPSVIPITQFERAWVLNWLAPLDVAAPPGVVASLAASLGELGTSGGAGLPPDADTTSVALVVLQRHDLDCLFHYETETHFCTWPGERTPSVTTNAHVLDALSSRLRNRSTVPGPPTEPPSAYDEPPSAYDDKARRYATTRDKLTRWLCELQSPAGWWTDKWHASAYYATVCCALALSRVPSPAARAAVRRATAWVLATQRLDGSWGRWTGTREETAYAMHILLLAPPAASAPAQVARAVAQARAFLTSASPTDPPLWHDKDLYLPRAVVEAAIIAALYASSAWVPTRVPRQRPPSTME